ncbi:MAG: hypothetical protein HY722_15015 [Planctomycetes bacterium]|nr:hypothetical protein [Planctomycetota bacterium]
MPSNLERGNIMTRVRRTHAVAAALLSLLAAPAALPGTEPFAPPPGRKLRAMGVDRALDRRHLSLHYALAGRLSLNSMDNVVDLSDDRDGDSSQYLGATYTAELWMVHDDGPFAYGRLKEAGPAGFNAPIIIDGDLETLFGTQDEWRGRQNYPALDIVYGDVPLAGSARAQAGLVPFKVGNGFAIGGKFANYGVNVYDERAPLPWRVHWSRPDQNNEWFLGTSKDQDKNQVARSENTQANLYALQGRLPAGKHQLEAYAGVLHDRTGQNQRDVAFRYQPSPNLRRIHEDTLGTAGADLDLDLDRFALGLEGAKNFGKANGLSGTRDVRHGGYLLYGDARWDKAMTWPVFITPTARALQASGNKDTQQDYDAAAGGVYRTRGGNRAFSVFSPLNTGLFDTVFPASPGPVLTMARGYTINYGMPRPHTFSDPHLAENLQAASLGFHLRHHSLPVFATVDWWYLRAQHPGFRREGGVTRPLDPELGHEVDAIGTWLLSDHLSLQVIAAWFLPGAYYQGRRTANTAGPFAGILADDFLLASPNVVSGGDPDPAWQFEGALNLNF